MLRQLRLAKSWVNSRGAYYEAYYQLIRPKPPIGGFLLCNYANTANNSAALVRLLTLPEINLRTPKPSICAAA